MDGVEVCWKLLTAIKQLKVAQFAMKLHLHSCYTQVYVYHVRAMRDC